MKTNSSFNAVFHNIICILYIMLFVYAAVSKILDFENFEVQLGQSPLLSIYASWISWLVIIVELTISASLLLPKWRLLGLYASLGLMTMFSAYIFIILNFSSFIPCSCGGILEKMSWNAHLIFNCTFIALSLFAIVLNKRLNNKKSTTLPTSGIVKSAVGIMTCSILIVLILFLSSKNIIHHNNPFIRTYPNHPAEFSNTIDLKHHSYYIAGFANNRIYLGNYQYPMYVLSVDQNLKNKKLDKLHFDAKKIPFQSITISVREPYFYLSDGSVPVLLRGDMKNWTINRELNSVPYFTRVLPIDSSMAVFRSNNSKKLANVLGIYNADAEQKTTYSRELLQSHNDGIFDTDGTLLYSEATKKIIYLYYYRNEFMTAEKNGKLITRGHTIDTISHPNLKVSLLKDGKQYAMSTPSFVVNANAAVVSNLLFVHSRVKGRYENKKLWDKSFIIDVYDLKNNTYLLSFPIFHTSSNVLNSFAATDTHLYAIIGNDLVVYELKKIIKNEIQ